MLRMQATQQDTSRKGEPFRVGQRVHYAGNPTRTGTVKYVGPLEGHPGDFIGVDWDADGQGKHDGSHNGVRYFAGKGPKTASFLRSHNLSSGLSLIEALENRYRTASSKEDEEEMYVLSARNRRVSIQLLGKEKIEDKVSHLEEMISASLSYLGVSSPGSPNVISSTLPNLKELDLTGNLLVNWEDIFVICESLPSLTILNLSSNLMSPDISNMHELSRIRILVLNQAGITWKQIQALDYAFPHLNELHAAGNQLREIMAPLSAVIGFNYLKLLDLDNNSIFSWDEVTKFSHLCCLEQLFLNNNRIKNLRYPNFGGPHESLDENLRPFKSLQSLHLGGNMIEDMESVNSLNSFPKLIDIRLSDNPVSDLGKGGAPRFVITACLAKVKILNGSEVSSRERKESEIRYVRLVMSKLSGSPEEISRLHPRFAELKKVHGIEDERLSIGVSGPQKMASGLISITLKCIGASMCEKAPLTKKLPASTTVGKLKNLCQSFFKLPSIKPVLYLQEEGSPLPTMLDDDMSSLFDLGISNESTILVSELS